MLDFINDLVIDFMYELDHDNYYDHEIVDLFREYVDGYYLYYSDIYKFITDYYHDIKNMIDELSYDLNDYSLVDMFVKPEIIPYIIITHFGTNILYSVLDDINDINTDTIIDLSMKIHSL